MMLFKTHIGQAHICLGLPVDWLVAQQWGIPTILQEFLLFSSHFDCFFPSHSHFRLCHRLK